MAPKLYLAAKTCRMFVEHRLAEAGATFATWTVLTALKLDGPMIQRALASALSIEGATLSRHLEGLEARGLVQRTRSGSDRRAAEVELTERGEEVYARLSAVAIASYQQMLGDLTEREIAQLMRLLDRLIENVGQPT